MRLFALISLVVLSVWPAIGSTDNSYFSQFLYQAVNTENDPDFPPQYIYYFAGTTYPFTAIAGLDEELTVDLDLFLQTDGTYQIFYMDGVQALGKNSGSIRQCLQLSGTWSVSGTTLTLTDTNGKTILQGVPSTWGGQNTFTGTFTAQFPVAELHGVQHIFAITQSQQPQSSYTCTNF